MNNKVSRYQMGMLLFLIYCSLYIGLGDIILLRKSGTEIIFSMIFGIILGYIPLFMYLKINSYMPNCNIFEKNIKLFGNIIGKVLNILLIFIYLCFFIISIREIIVFVSSKYLKNTPYFLLGLLVVITSIIICFKGLEAFLRVSRLSFLTVVLFIIIIEIALIKYVEIGNLFPMLTGNNYIKNIISGALAQVSFCTMPVMLLFTIRKNDIKESEKFNKTMIIFYTISGISLTLVIFFLITCFDYNLSTLFRYPEYITLKKIGFSSSELHLENLFAFRWIYYMASLNTLSTIGIKCGIKTFIKNEKYSKIIVFIITIIACIASKYILGNINESIIIANDYYTLVIIIPLFFILTIVFIKCLISKKQI